MELKKSIVLELMERIQSLESRVLLLEKSQGKYSLDSVSETPTRKYIPLSQFLKISKKEKIKLTFSEIEEILGFPLPDSAANYRPFWANSESHSIALSWLSTGYRVHEVNLNEKFVIFVTNSFFMASKKKIKSFYIGNDRFTLELGYYNGRTFRLSKENEGKTIDLEGNQKYFIVSKLKEIENFNHNIDISDEEREYIRNYPKRKQGQNSNKLAKMLYRLLPENEEPIMKQEVFLEDKKEKTQADKLREFCNETYIIPARNRREKTVTIRAGDVRNALNVRNMMPEISNALRGKKFEELAHVRLVNERTPPSGAGMNSYFTFDILPVE